MEANLNHILIFRTNIGKLCENCPLHKALEQISAIQQWTIDHKDKDCVLRIVSETLSAENIIGAVKAHGFECAELE